MGSKWEVFGKQVGSFWEVNHPSKTPAKNTIHSQSINYTKSPSTQKSYCAKPNFSFRQRHPKSWFLPRITSPIQITFASTKSNDHETTKNHPAHCQGIYGPLRPQHVISQPHGILQPPGRYGPRSCAPRQHRCLQFHKRSIWRCGAHPVRQHSIYASQRCSARPPIPVHAVGLLRHLPHHDHLHRG